MSKRIEIREALMARLRSIPVVDAHEHLPSEQAFNAEPISALTLYRQYTRLPMFASGLSPDDFQRIHDPELPVRRRWKILEPHLDKVKHTSFARVAQITLRHFWDAEGLTSESVEELSERIAAENTDGVYQRVLAEHCLIRCVLNQDTTRSHPQELDPYRAQKLLLPVVRLIDTEAPENAFVSRLSGEDGFGTLDDYIEWARTRLAGLAAGGAVALKTCALPYLAPDKEQAVEEFEALRAARGRLDVRSVPGPLLSYIHDELLRVASGLGLPVAVHTGFWGDFRKLNPTHMIPLIQRYPEIHLDLFHLGVPWVRETGIIAVNFPNVSVNMCWAHSINAAMAQSALDEYIDQLGADKIIAFGGDVRWMVHDVYGHLELARRNVAAVLGRRIEADLMDLDAAERLARAWFFDNPARIYGLTDAIRA